MPLQSWLLVFTKRDQSKALDFLHSLKRITNSMGIKVNDYQCHLNLHSFQFVLQCDRLLILKWLNFLMIELIHTYVQYVLKSTHNYRQANSNITSVDVCVYACACMYVIIYYLLSVHIRLLWLYFQHHGMIDMLLSRSSAVLRSRFHHK